MAKLFLPHRYQLRGIAECLTTRFLALFLDPGLGKTAIMLWVYCVLKKQNKTNGMLVVAPMRVALSVWQKEVKKWTFSRKLVVRTLHGDMKDWQLSQPADIYVVNVEGLKWLLTKGLKGKRNWPFDMLVVDESGKFKNPTSRRLKLLTKKLLKFRRRYILNGTPAPKGYVDLWSQMLLIDRGVALGARITHFREDYLESDYMKYNWTIRNDAAAETIQRKIAPICLVMESKDYLDMPPINFPIRRVELPPPMMEKYREAEQELFTEFEFEKLLVELEIKNLAAATGMCRQLSSGAFYEPLTLEQTARPPASKDRIVHQIHDVKMDSLLDLVDELQGKPLLIAYDFWHSYDRIRKAIKKSFGINVPAINSDTSARQGVILEDKWNAGELRVLAGHPTSISYGLNMQESGNDICWFDPTWALDTFLQYLMRVWRQGKDDPVRVHQIIATGTIEDVMIRRIKDKHETEQDLKKKLKHYRNIRLQS